MSTTRITAAAGAAVLLAAAAVPAPAADYRLLSSWDKRSPVVAIIAETYAKNVEAATKGGIRMAISGPETVPAFEQLQPAGSGAFHFLFTTGAYHFGTTPYMTAIEALGKDMQERRAAGVHDMADKHYQKYGLKLVALPMSPMGGYNILLRQPVGPSGDLQGRKIRGIPSYQNVITMLGASTVVLPPAEIYQALEKGVVDGSSWPSSGILDYKFHEVARYLLRPTFGFVAYPIFMNLAAYNKLTPAEKKVLADEGRKVEDHTYKEMGILVDNEVKELQKRGASFTEMGPSQKAKLASAWSDGLWNISSQKAKKEIDELRAWAKSKGLD